MARFTTKITLAVAVLASMAMTVLSENQIDAGASRSNLRQRLAPPSFFSFGAGGVDNNGMGSAVVSSNGNMRGSRSLEITTDAPLGRGRNFLGERGPRIRKTDGDGNIIYEELDFVCSDATNTKQEEILCNTYCNVLGCEEFADRNVRCDRVQGRFLEAGGAASVLQC